MEFSLRTLLLDLRKRGQVCIGFVVIFSFYFGRASDGVSDTISGGMWFKICVVSLFFCERLEDKSDYTTAVMG